MHKYKKLYAFVLLFSLAVSLAACGKEEDPAKSKTEVTSAVSQTETQNVDETGITMEQVLPKDLDYDGLTIRFIAAEGGNGNLTQQSIAVDEDSGDIVDAAVYQRNLNVEDFLAVNIELTKLVNGDELNPIIEQSVGAGSDDYDIIAGYSAYAILLAPEGCVIKLNELPFNDFKREYWPTDYINSMSYRDVVFWTTGDMALRYTGGVYCTYVNSRIWNDYFSDTNIYQIVRDGKWTLDTMREYSRQVYKDLNGNSLVDETDQLGFIITTQDPIDGMSQGSMIFCSAFDEDGVPYFTLQNERTHDFYEKLFNLGYRTEGSTVVANDDSVTVMTLFAQGNALFTINKLFQSHVYLRDMQDDYSIIPLPKLDETQVKYNSMVHDGCTIFGIPVTCMVTDACSAVLEALEIESVRLVTPAYYDMALKVKYSRDEESAEMIDLIHNNISSDFCSVYHRATNFCVHIFRDMMGDKKPSIATHLEKKMKGFNTSLAKLIVSLEKYT